MVSTDEQKHLEELAYQVRKLVLDLACRGGCFVGSSFSCVELIVYLYEKYLKYNFRRPDDPSRDIFLLSKGHATSALYSYLRIKGLISERQLSSHNVVGSNFYWHPNAAVQGVEFVSGSLGHLPSVAAGIALHFKSASLPNRVVVVVGDGELNEGSVWESILIASSLKLDNLTIVVDRNNFQANFRTEQLNPLEPLKLKFEAFGCHVTECAGHSFASVHGAIEALAKVDRKPKVLIASTKRGKGLKGYEDNWEKWFVKLKRDEAHGLIETLERLNEIN